MSDSEVTFTDSFDGSGQDVIGAGWASNKVGSVAFGFDGARSGTVAATCVTCGWTLILHEGDQPIPLGDPRLCEHIGGPRPPAAPGEPS